jgi:hypothetical protein
MLFVSPLKRNFSLFLLEKGKTVQKIDKELLLNLQNIISKLTLHQISAN